MTAALSNRLKTLRLYTFPFVVSACIFGAGCSQKNPTAAGTSVATPPRFEPRAIGNPASGHPWITDIELADLNGDGLIDVIACEGQLNQVIVLWQGAGLTFKEEVVSTSVRGPAHIEISDMNGDGRPDLLVAGMGSILPSTEKTGTVTILLNQGHGEFGEKVVATGLPRVTFVGAGDFNKDGKPDLVVGAFGYLQGGVYWMENLGNNVFRSHALLDMPGTIHAPAVDLDGDGNLDIVALVSQDSEEVHLFKGDGAGHFKDIILNGSTNKDFGSSGLVVADLNGDGRLDIIYTNGDGFDYATPGSRPWHGAQWLENKGDGHFEFHRLGFIPGAYSPILADLNGDGRKDVIVSSGFNDWTNHNAVCLAGFLNGPTGFQQVELSHALTHLVVVRAADLDGDGRVELVSGAFMLYPPFDRPSRITLWEQKR